MSLTLNASDWYDLCEQAAITGPNDLTIDEFDIVSGHAAQVGQGYCREVTLTPGVTLSFAECQFHQDLQIEFPAHDHPIQITLHLSGVTNCSIHPILGGTCGYFSGSGISPGYAETYRAGQHVSYVSVEIQPGVLDSLFLNDQQRHCNPIQQLFKATDLKTSFYPKVTSQMRSLAHQMWHAPYRGAAKRMYLQAKAFELLALHLDLISGYSQESISGLKPDTLDRIHHAQEILTTHLENPPSLLALAQQVGVSDRTLRRGCRELFGTTVIGYLTRQRMQRAKQLLQEGQWTVTEVARIVGYGHLGHFAAAFKRQFGITPKQCLLGNHSG